MPDLITVDGVIATPPKNVVTEAGLKITSFRLASQQRRYDKVAGAWIDTDTNWFTVTTFRALAENAQASLSKGDRVLVHGRLRLREWTNGERSGMTVEIEADSVGHDLAWGRTEYRRVVRTAPGVTQDATADAGTGMGMSTGTSTGTATLEAGDPGAPGDPDEAPAAETESAESEPGGASQERPEPVGAGTRPF